MPKLTSALLLLVLLSVLGFLMGADAPQAGDLEKLQGRWAVVAADAKGKAMLKTELDTMIFEFQNDVMSIIMAERGKEKGRITLDEKSQPKSMNLEPINEKDVHPSHDGPALFIYELKDDELRLCWCKPGGVRPTEFVGDKTHTLMKLRRIKATTQPDEK